MRTAHSLLRLVSLLLDLAQDALLFLLLGTRSSTALKAENIFLRKQLALYVEREAKPRRATDATPWGEYQRPIAFLCRMPSAAVVVTEGMASPFLLSDQPSGEVFRPM
jgi:hypothetical protein